MRCKIIGICCCFFLIVVIFMTSSFAFMYNKENNNNNEVNVKTKFFTEVHFELQNEDKNIRKNKSITSEGKTINLEYKESKMGKEVYSDNVTGDKYILNGEKVVGFIKKTDVAQSRNKMVSLDEAKKIAIDFVNIKVDDFSDYEIYYSNYTKAYDEYSIIFMNKLNGINTQDTIKVNVSGTGEVASYSAFHRGEFAKYDNININFNEVNNIVIDKIKEKYGISLKEVSIKDQFLRIIDGRLTLQNDIIVIMDTNTSEITQGESVLYFLD